MPTETLVALLSATALLAGWAMTLAAALVAWRGWLRVRIRLERRSQHAPAQENLPAATMIDLANLRERIRKLEAIAAGINP